MPAFFLLALIAALGLAADGCSRGEPLPVADYRSTPGNLNGNHYVLEAEVDSQLRGQEGVGRLISVRPLNEKGRLAVFVPDTLKANLIPTQRYRFDIAVRTGGLLYVSQLKKI
ncbi:MAG: hypothetical protein WCL04_06680 [Verrucomicrobiota bacterium]